jgi:hypothetical protein
MTALAIRDLTDSEIESVTGAGFWEWLGSVWDSIYDWFSGLEVSVEWHFDEHGNITGVDVTWSSG